MEWVGSKDLATQELGVFIDAKLSMVYPSIMQILKVQIVFQIYMSNVNVIKFITICDEITFSYILINKV